MYYIFVYINQVAMDRGCTITVKQSACTQKLLDRYYTSLEADTAT